MFEVVQSIVQLNSRLRLKLNLLQNHYRKRHNKAQRFERNLELVRVEIVLVRAYQNPNYLREILILCLER